MAETTNQRTIVINYIFEQFFNSDIDSMVGATGYSLNKITRWLSGEIVPNHTTIAYVNNCIFTPEFTVVSEFYEIYHREELRPQLKDMFNGHEHRSGIYAFYDSMANLLYVGKASNLFNEIYAALRRSTVIPFPSGVKNKKVRRYKIAKYISAYDVKIFDHFDYPKHVESIILRISKPRLNKQIGRLEEAYPDIIE